MEAKVERRALQRFEIPGAKVYYKKDTYLKIFRRYLNFLELIDITKSGVRLKIKNGIKKGDRLQLQMVFPGESKIEVKGQVRWKNPEDRNHSYIGIQFEPFGMGRKLNPITSLEKLRELSGQYVH